MSTPETHRGWVIEQNWLGEYEATHPDFDPTPMHLDDGPGDNRWVVEKTMAAVKEAIDDWHVEHATPDQQRRDYLSSAY